MRPPVELTARLTVRRLFLFLLPFLIISDLSAETPELLTLTIEAESGKPVARFKVELADTPEKMSRGLMYRTGLPADQGMFFVLGAPRIATFWMRNTFVPLDMIFIRQDGEIESIVTREDTLSPDRSRSIGPVAYVLEINAGQSEILGIAPGHYVRLGSARGDR